MKIQVNPCQRDNTPRCGFPLIFSSNNFISYLVTLHVHVIRYNNDMVIEERQILTEKLVILSSRCHFLRKKETWYPAVLLLPVQINRFHIIMT